MFNELARRYPETAIEVEMAKVYESRKGRLREGMGRNLQLSKER
jgi:hypothetical protein